MGILTLCDANLDLRPEVGRIAGRALHLVLVGGRQVVESVGDDRGAAVRVDRPAVRLSPDRRVHALEPSDEGPDVGVLAVRVDAQIEVVTESSPAAVERALLALEESLCPGMKLRLCLTRGSCSSCYLTLLRKNNLLLPPTVPP
jgi:hypothetical protein